MERPRKRLGHRKSRNGCLRCKARRVKCDEQRPCFNCARHHVVCSLAGTTEPQAGASVSALTPTSPWDNGQPSQSLQPQTRSQSLESPRVSCSEVGGLSPSPGTPHIISHHVSPDWPQTLSSIPPSIGSSSLHAESPSVSNRHFSSDWLQSLRLMHHYCTYTCEILPSENANRELWKVAIPEAASSYEFLMHGLLALGALHYAFIHPDKRRDYNLISTHYQNLMLPYFAASLHSINEENCEAYFLLATLISVLSLCWVTHSETLERIIGPSDVAQSFMFFQGVKGILDFQPMDKWRQSGSLAHLLRPPVKSGQSVVQSRYLARLDRVTGLARQLPATLEVINSQTACILALESLRATYNLCRNVEEKPGSPWRWAIYLPDLFLELMGKGEPTSLIILAHFAALARLYERKNWVREGWSVSVITMVERNLDPESQEWIKWPRRSIIEEIDIDEESLE